MNIAKEGLPFIAGAGIAGACLWFIVKPIGIIVLAGAVFFLYFFRDPHRNILQSDNGILAPADGKVMEIANEGNIMVIRIFLSVFNVHIQRSPVAGMIKSVVYQPGKFLPAMNVGAHIVNEQNIFTVETPHGEIVVRQIAGILARRVVSWVVPGQAVEAGQKIGIIKFGSQVDVAVPAAAQMLVKKGDHVIAGVTVLARGALKPS